MKKLDRLYRQRGKRRRIISVYNKIVKKESFIRIQLNETNLQKIKDHLFIESKTYN